MLLEANGSRVDDNFLNSIFRRHTQLDARTVDGIDCLVELETGAWDASVLESFASNCLR